jgi:hypothetical protein
MALSEWAVTVIFEKTIDPAAILFAAGLFSAAPCESFHKDATFAVSVFSSTAVGHPAAERGRYGGAV